MIRAEAGGEEPRAFTCTTGEKNAAFQIMLGKVEAYWQECKELKLYSEFENLGIPIQL